MKEAGTDAPPLPAVQVRGIPFEEVPQFSKRDRAYVSGDPALRPFYKYPFELEAFAQAIEDKKRQPVNRELLVEVLLEQLKGLEEAPAVAANVQLLKEGRTFTVVTAHQPCLFTGPLYYVVKIFSTLHLAAALQRHYPDYRFVPVFVSGSEDHDFEEINHAYVFGKELRWEAPAGGPVGKLPTHTLKGVLQQLEEILGQSESAQRIFQRIAHTHTAHPTYGRAVQAFVHSLFKDFGLVVLDMSHPKLKAAFAPLIEEEIFQQPSHRLIESTVRELEAAGFQEQAHPREINFFYLPDGRRERIVEENGTFHVLNTELRFSPAEMKAEIAAHPERFSPNVVMRPIYQEFALPNLAYIGGGGELAYWMERKRQFEHFGVNFPMLVRRNSLLWIDRTQHRRMRKLGLTPRDLLLDTETLVKQYLARHAVHEISLAEEKAELRRLFEAIARKAAALDTGLEKGVWAEHARQLKSLEHLETKLVRAEKQRHETALNQLRNLKEKLFPGNGLQERRENFLSLFTRYGEAFFDLLFLTLDPFRKELLVFEDEG
ncbi:MAG: bacillithiol biosynthesis cysteine-adding enzyme BshC [Bacteroidetes bacterium]|nr:MAG: bacillithiol biosynthesis cysteine-adding enzyme BshC [Bacteroidota bacterium]